MSNNKAANTAPSVRHYIRAVERRLNLPHKIRKRVISDFSTTISARREQGEGLDAIIASLGSPAQAAAELNEQMKEYAYSKSRWRFVFLGAAVLPLGWLLMQVLIPATTMLISFPSEAASIGIIGGADGPTAILVAPPPISAGYIIKISAAALSAAAAIYGFVRLGRIKNRK